MKWSLMGCALALGAAYTSTALSKPYNAGSPFQVNLNTQNSNPIFQKAVLGHYSSDPSVVEVVDSFGNHDLVMVSSSDLVMSNANDAKSWPMKQTYLYAMSNYSAADPIITTWYDHGPVVSESSFNWSKLANQLWAPDVQYYSATNDLWLYIPDRDKNNTFRIGMAHATVSNGIYSDSGFTPVQTPMSITGAPGGAASTAFDPGVYSDEVAAFNRRTFMVYADREFGDGSGNNLSMAELGPDHQTATYLGKIQFQPPFSTYTGISKNYMEGPDIFVMQMPGLGGRLFYYLVFTTNVERGTDDTGYIGYAMCSDQDFHNNPTSCWQFKGWIFRNMHSGRSNHASLISYGNGHYVFYHTAPAVCCSPEKSRARQVAVKEIQIRDHQGFADDGEIVGVTYPTGSDKIEDATKYGTLDGLSTTLQPAFISVQDEDATSANSSTLDFKNFVNPSTSVTLRRGLDRLYYYFDADPGLNIQVQQPSNVTQSDLVLDAPPIKHVNGDTWAIVMEYTGGDVPPGALSNVSVQLRVTGDTKANDFSRALGYYVTPTTRLLLSDLNNGYLAGEAPNTSALNFRVLYTQHQDGQGQFTYLTTSFSDPNVGINNQYLMTGSQSQDWFLEAVTDFSNLQGLGSLTPTDKLNAIRLRCRWTNFYMTSNDVQKGTAAQPKFWVLSQALNPQWSTQVWIKETVGDGSVRMRSAWLPDAARDSSRLPIYLTLQAATPTGKQDVFVQLNTNLDRQKWYIE